jgi:hypothetical protein
VVAAVAPSRGGVEEILEKRIPYLQEEGAKKERKISSYAKGKKNHFSSIRQKCNLQIAAETYFLAETSSLITLPETVQVSPRREV